MDILSDRYFLLCVSVAFVILASTFVSGEVIESDDGTVGIIYEVKESAKGYVFLFQNTKGESMKCYFQKQVSEGTYSIKGRFSDDRTIFFVSSAQEIRSEALSGK